MILLRKMNTTPTLLTVMLKKDLKENQREVLGFISVGHVRNFGLEKANGNTLHF